MGRSRTAGIVTDAGGNRIINKIHQGTRIYARLGRVTLAAAESDLRRRIAEVEEETQRGSAARRTFGKACIRYLSEKSAKRSIDTDAYHIGLIEPWLGPLDLVAIHNDTPELVAFRKHRLEVDKVCLTTVKRTLEVLRHILNLAARHCWICQRILMRGRRTPWRGMSSACCSRGCQSTWLKWPCSR